MASDTTTPIDSLPNEILDSILSPLSTQDLIKLAPVNRRIYTIILRLVQHRLAAVLDQKSSQELILECYPPSAALTTPYLFCDFVETSRLDGSGSTLLDPKTELDGGSSSSNGTLGDLRSLYSRFRPVVQDENRRPRHRYPRQSSSLEDGEEEEEVVVPESPPSLDVHLDEGEQFSQLVTVTNVVEMGSRRGQFLGHANFSDGVLRVWRAWLAAATSAAGGQGEQREAILWADAERHVGVRFRVSRKDAWSQPLLLGADEDPPVSYRLDYEELVVRTSQLLLTMERSESQVATSSGSSIYIDPRGSVPQPVQALYYPFYPMLGYGDVMGFGKVMEDLIKVV
ncbi:hypothetical protein PspLS_05186 [Pyricularia sp. CBS 133598]|nr:hypothetical protein PspLS_05186 [Pyricularia sp. CBS 133598]